MDDDDEKNEAEESDPLTLMGLDQEFGNVVCGSGHAVKMGFRSMTKGQKSLTLSKEHFFSTEPDRTLKG